MKIQFPNRINEILTDYFWEIPLKSQSLIYSDFIGNTKYKILIKGCIPDWFPKKLLEALTYIKENSPKRYDEILKSTKKIKVGKPTKSRTMGESVPSGIIYINYEFFKETYPTDLSAIIFHETLHNRGLDEVSAEKATNAYLNEMHTLGRHPTFQNYTGKRYA